MTAQTLFESPTAEIVRTVAARENVDPVEIEQPLFEAIDPEALDALLQHDSEETTDSSIRVEFSYCGYDLLVTSSGDVRIADET
jgi:hypothetical protein